ncbi:hypothetical protein CDAR_462641 [Caerostris darwini]|uniref:Uncharacterized protein n=1 Tax=Caerostris darwini TaxID=1538125 RepID=A0AAV4WP35_9ARAC|nr:hypothetical protein CDAR_462641 [Caerostris darwini]
MKKSEFICNLPFLLTKFRILSLERFIRCIKPLFPSHPPAFNLMSVPPTSQQSLLGRGQLVFTDSAVAQDVGKNQRQDMRSCIVLIHPAQSMDQ